MFKPDLVKQFLHDQNAAVAMEYALLGALIGIAAMAAFTAFGNSLQALFNRVENTTSGPLAASGI
jgi:Flp pilus assembly pilin Flp